MILGVPTKKKSKGVRSGDLADHSTGLLFSIQWPDKR